MKTLEVLRKFENDTKKKFNTEVYIVGGFVRDLLRRRSNIDLDIVVRHVTLNFIEKFLKPYGRTKRLTIHNVSGTDPITFVVFKAKNDSTEAQIATVKGSGKQKNNISVSLKHDSNQRDFTINAMYLPINKTSSKNVIDFHGGKNDITAKQILSVGSAKDKFIKSPIRILRAFSMAARTNYTISNHVKHAISECVGKLKRVSQDSIRLELEDILLSSKPSTQFKTMQKLGVLKIILPELNDCIKSHQDKKYHKYTVFGHLIYTCDNTFPNLTLRLAGLLHDIGKPIVRKTINGKVTFHKHEVIGAKEAAVILKRLRFDKKTIKDVVHLIRMHMYHYTREYTDAGVRRFIINSGITEKDVRDIDNFPLFQLRKADRLGNGFKTQPVTKRQLDFEARIKKIFKSSTGFAIQDLLIDGNDIIKVFKLKQSEKIGNILKYLLKLIITDPKLNTRAILLHKTLDYLLNEESITNA